MLFSAAMNYYYALEFSRVLTLASDYAASPATAHAIRKISLFSEPDALQREYAVLNEMLDLLEHQGGFSLSGLVPLDRELKTLGTPGQVLAGEDFLAIHSLLELSTRISGLLDSVEDSYPQLAELTGQLTGFNDELRRIDRTFDSDGTILDTASRELKQIRNEIRRAEQRLEKDLSGLARKLAADKIAQDAVVMQRNGHWVIPVRENMRGRVPGMVIDQSDSGATVFMEPSVSLENQNHIQRARVQEQKEVVRILRELTASLAERLPELQTATEILHRLDFLSAKAQYGRHLSGRVPQVSPDMTLVVQDARHPLLLEKQEVVPLNLQMNAQQRVLLISGPNAGGKTVVLKTLGLLALMVRAGLPIPAGKETRIPFFSDVLTDIGDEQSIDNDLSTFSSHMQRSIGMVNAYKAGNLFLIDEMGSGTDPDEGAALARAILERLLISPGLTVVTTHLGSLKAFAHTTKGIRNGSMAFNEKELSPTYRFIPDVPGASYAQAIAQRMGAPRFILDRARYYMGDQKKSLEKLISSLRGRLDTYNRKIIRIEARETELESLLANYKARIKGVRQEANEIKRKATEEANRVLDEANRKIEGAVREIRSSQAAAETIREQRQQVENEKARLSRKLKKLEGKQDKPQFDLQPGYHLRMRDMTEAVEVISVDQRRRRFVGQAGLLKMTFGFDDILEIRKEPKPARDQRGVTVHADSQREITLDVRGEKVDAALNRVDAWIDRCILNDLQVVTILHGKGTGVLRQEIQLYLRTVSAVKSFRDGTLPEGGSGVTVVKLNT